MDFQGLISGKKLCYLLKNRQVVIVNQEAEISDLSDSKRKIVCVQKGSTGYDALKYSNIISQVLEIIELENMVNCLNEVKLFKSGTAVVDELIVKYYLKGLNNKYIDFKMILFHN